SNMIHLSFPFHSTVHHVDLHSFPTRRSSDLIDIRQALNLSYVYDLPFGRSRRFGGSWNRGTDLLLGGWTLDGFVRAQTGRPYNVVFGSDRANVGRTYQRPDALRNPNNGPKTPEQWF